MIGDEVASKIIAACGKHGEAPAARRVLTIETMGRSLPAVRNFVKLHKGFRDSVQGLPQSDALRTNAVQLLRAVYSAHSPQR